ncbi:Diaminopimelate epimerase, partial [Bienertia sinuspersici]
MEVTITRDTNLVGEYDKANESIKNNAVGGRLVDVWKAPDHGFYKITSDAAFYDGRLVGIGAVTRDSMGEVMVSTCWQQNEIKEVEVGEANAARHALSIAIQAGLRSCYDLKKEVIEPTYFGVIISDILAIAKHCQHITYSHVKRGGNVVAHELAKLASSFVDMRVWIEEVLEQITNF